MKLYDEIINKWNSQINDCSTIIYDTFELDKDYDKWTDVGNHQMIFGSDMAYELGGSSNSLYAIGSTVVTTDDALVPKDEIIVLGPDLKDIKSDISYARLSLLKIKNTDNLNGNALYNAIKSYDYVRYHVNPEGFMTRVSSVYSRESVRVSKKAIEEGLSFEHVGNIMLRQFHVNKTIEAVKIIFITDPAFNYKALEEDTKKAINITKTIDHIMKDAMSADCSSCSLQEICDEVEGLRELHFNGVQKEGVKKLK